jgi:predicted DNA-binding protein
MGKLEVTLPEPIEEELEARSEQTGRNKSEITRGALVERLEI